jgi:nitrite reductase/ring-hydroxylating ferredoxin subunit
MAEYLRVASVDQLQPDRGLLVEAAGKRIAVFKLGADYFAIDDACTHVGGPLSEGNIMGQSVICPWHGAQFNLATGQCTPPARGPLQRYPVRVNGSDIEVAVEIVA